MSMSKRHSIDIEVESPRSSDGSPDSELEEFWAKDDDVTDELPRRETNPVSTFAVPSGTLASSTTGVSTFFKTSEGVEESGDEDSFSRRIGVPEDIVFNEARDKPLAQLQGQDESTIFDGNSVEARGRKYASSVQNESAGRLEAEHIGASESLSSNVPRLIPSSTQRLPGDYSQLTLPLRVSHRPETDPLAETRQHGSGLEGKVESSAHLHPRAEARGLKLKPALEVRPPDDDRHREIQDAGVVDWAILIGNCEDEEKGVQDDSQRLKGECLDRLGEDLVMLHEVCMRKLTEEPPVQPEWQQYQAEVMTSAEERGTIAHFLALEHQNQERVQLDDATLISFLKSEFMRRENQVKACRVSTLVTKISIQESLQLIQEVGEKLQTMRRDVVQMLGEDEVRFMSQRHNMLEQLLKGNRPRGASQVFTADIMGQVMDWYIRVNEILKEIEHFKDAYKLAVNVGKTLLERFPVREGGESAARSVLSRIGQEGSLGTTLGMGSARGSGGDDDVSSEGTLKGSVLRERLTDLGRNHRMRAHTVNDNLRYPSNVVSGQGTVEDPHLLSTRRVSATPLPKTSRVEGPPAWNSRRGADTQLSSSRGGDGSDELSEASSSFTSRAEVLLDVEEYASKRLSELEILTHDSLKILTSNVPSGRLTTRSGGMPRMLDYGTKAMAAVTPFAKDGYINVAEWWETLNRQLDDHGVSIPLRFRVIAKTGGLADKGYELIRRKVRAFMKPRELAEWLPEYDHTHEERDLSYWLNLWVDLGVKLISEFYVCQDENTIEEGLDNMFKDKLYRISNESNSLNTEFYKVQMVFKDSLQYLKERGSQMADTPAFVMKKLQTWLKHKQGPIGVQMDMILSKAILKVGRDPLSVLPPGHRMSDQALSEIKQNGVGRLPERIYLLILKELNRKAAATELSFDIQTSSQLSQIYDITSAERRRERREKSANNVRTERAEPVNHVRNERAVNNATVTNSSPRVENPKCITCNMYCGTVPGKCNYWNSTTKSFDIKGFLSLDRNRYVTEDGRQYLGNQAFKRLQQFGLPHLGIKTDAEISKLQKAMKEAAKAMPLDPERWKTVHRGARQVNFALTDPQDQVNDQPSELILSEVADMKRELANMAKVSRNSHNRGSYIPKKKKKRRGSYSDSSSSSEDNRVEYLDESSEDGEETDGGY